MRAIDDCCSEKAVALTTLQERQAATLWLALAINSAMFVVELVSGLLAGSVALLADSLDMLGDALVYGFSLYVVARALRWKARAAMAKATVMAVFGILVLGQLVHHVLHPQVPAYETMGVVGCLALAANAFCFTLLWRHRGEDINMRAVWLCSRNDLLANVLVLGATVAVWRANSAWPDIIAGTMICFVFLRSAVTVIQDARRAVKADDAHVPFTEKA